MRNNNGAPFGVIRERQIARQIAVPAGVGFGGFGGFGGAPDGGAAGGGAGAGGFGGAQAGGGAGAGAGAGGAIFGGGAGAGAGFGGAQVGAGAGAGGFGGAPAGGGAGANNDRPVTPPDQIFPFATAVRQIDTPPRLNGTAQPQVPVQPNQVAAQPIVDQAHLVNGIDTPPPSPRGNQ